MEMRKLDIQKVSGAPKPDCVCQVFTNRLILADSQIATLVSVFLVKTDNHEDLQKLLSEVFELSIQKIEEGNIYEGALAILSNAALKVTQFLEQENVKASFAHTLFYKDAVYIARHGDSVKLLVFEPESSQEIKFQEGSGRVKDNQLFLIATEKFLSIFDIAPLKLLSDIDLEDIIDGLATDISAEEDQSEIAAAFVLVTSKDSGEGPEQSLSNKSQYDLNEDLIPREEIEAEKSVQNELDLGQADDKTETKSILKTFMSKASFVLGKILIHVKKLKRGDVKAILGLRKNIALVAVVLLIVLAFSGGMTIRNKFQKEKLAKFATYVSSASAKFDEGNAIAELNRAKGRENFIEADKRIKLALEIFPKDDSAQKLSSEITSKLKETEQQNQLSFVTIGDFSEELRSINISANFLNLVTKKGTVKMNLADKSKNTKDVDENLKLGAFFANDAYVYSDPNLFKIDMASGAKKELFKKSGVQDLEFFIGNLYLLTKEGIAKFVPVENGFVEISDYLSGGFSAAVSSRLAIDCSIWVTKGAEILNFLQAEPKSFQISGLTFPLGEFGQIYTSSGIDNLYVIDKANSALLVISKDGVYLKVYQSGEFAKAQDLAVDSQEKKLYIAVGNKILEADL